MLTAAAVCPHPPLLIPAAIGAAASDPPPALRAVRDACDAAVHALAAAEPDLIAVVGGGPADREYEAAAAGSLGEFGVPVTVGEGEPVLPLSLTVGRWLLGRAGIGPGHAAARVAGHRCCCRRSTSGRPPMTASSWARRSPSGRPGSPCWPWAMRRRGGPATSRASPTPRAQDYDDEVAEALAAADARWLGRLDPALDGELLVAGRAAWQVLAGAAAGARMCGRLRCMASPYGVTYLVASWEEPRAD